MFSRSLRTVVASPAVLSRAAPAAGGATLRWASSKSEPFRDLSKHPDFVGSQKSAADYLVRWRILGFECRQRPTDVREIAADDEEGRYAGTAYRVTPDSPEQLLQEAAKNGGLAFEPHPDGSYDIADHVGMTLKPTRLVSWARSPQGTYSVQKVLLMQGYKTAYRYETVLDKHNTFRADAATPPLKRILNPQEEVVTTQGVSLADIRAVTITHGGLSVTRISYPFTPSSNLSDKEFSRGDYENPSEI